MSGALGVAAFVIVVLELAAAASAALLARRFWRQVEPTVKPMLAMFAPPAASTVVERIEASTSSSSDTPSPRSGSSS